MSEKEIQKQIAFVKDMKESLNTSLNHVKEYHLVVYGDIAGTVSHDQSTRSFYDHLRELKTGKWSESQCRRMDFALTEAAKCFRSDPNEVYHLIVLMTAGKQGPDKDNEETGKGLLESVAEELFSKKIKVIVVPVGLKTDFQELGSIVKRPQYLFPLSSFKDMDSDTAKKIALNIVETVGELFLFSMSFVKANGDGKFLFLNRSCLQKFASNLFSQFKQKKFLTENFVRHSLANFARIARITNLTNFQT